MVLAGLLKYSTAGVLPGCCSRLCTGLGSARRGLALRGVPSWHVLNGRRVTLHTLRCWPHHDAARAEQLW
jgi:hypothetical protein